MIDTTRAGRSGWLVLAGLLLGAAPALAAEPNGEWMVADGVAKVRIETCGSELWGVVSWEKVPGGIDQYNPDPAKRTRPTLGMPLLLGMQQAAPNRWDGEIYNAQNGKTYTANIKLASPDQLELQGCVLGFLCGGQTWTRTAAALPAQKPSASARPATAKPPARGTTGQAAAAPADGVAKTFETVKDVCTAVAEATGLPVVAEQPAAPASRPPAGGSRPVPR
ncbi:DUF2147 domain-containing protein [Rhodoplanes sp. TEM]|uniref:DUF2147 domain-containing protein n=1 Tax=Rhodoplanes tepidamans TaxID=200616 RepID=A0ABT5J931_RHOTP|nr:MULTISPECIES: DUF2147 domain-containing protein [Rhodoplanes]MDC7785977.1 DUF2147 domain-containing protein [Rhodoplanes tepidamans]MDC7987024.1 DUF2147 domain-containing protein [Rhodoplanes sp. TEM]MDQ0357056.1 uncharacterized protein (DUF2147 family) [Rhodoplanes tepidamans]